MNTARTSLPFVIEPLHMDLALSLLDYCVRNSAFLEPYEPARDASYYSLEHQKEIIRQAIRNKEQDAGYSFAILDPVSRQLIGRLNLANMTRGAFQNATIGYSLDEQYNSRGWMTEAVRWAITFGFQSLMLHRIQAGVMPRNHASIRVIEKVGFRYEGLAERYLKINGVWEDHRIYAITAEEWED